MKIQLEEQHRKAVNAFVDAKSIHFDLEHYGGDDVSRMRQIALMLQSAFLMMQSNANAVESFALEQDSRIMECHQANGERKPPC